MIRFIALVMFGFLVSLPAQADSYLSEYSSGSGSYYGSGSADYLSRYSNSGYSPPSGGGWYYGGAEAPTSHQHRASWEQYQRALHRKPTRSFFSGLTLQNTWASRQYIAWTGHYPKGFANSPCGNYQRAPVGCRATTTRYNPIIHGAR